MIAAQGKTAEPLRLLTVTSQPSDLVEMGDLAVALAQRGHHVTLLHFYSSTDPTISSTMERLIKIGREGGIATAGVDVQLIPPLDLQTFAEIEAAESAAALRTAPTGSKPRLIRMPKLPSLFGILHGSVSWARRRNWHRFYPKNTRVSRALYSLAFNIDNFRDPRELTTMLRQMLEMRVRVHRLRAVGRREALELAYRGAAMSAQYTRYLRLFLRFIKRRGFDAVLLPEDVVGHIWPVAIAAAHKRGIPALVLPYTLANREEAVQSLKGLDDYQTRNNELAARVYPRWRYQNGDVDLVRLPSGHIFAHEELGISPPDPWMMNSGFADRILVDSRASLDYFTAGGVPGDRQVVVGSVSQDRMFGLRQQRMLHLQELRAELGLAGEKPLLLISGCPNQLSASVPFCEFATMQEVANFVGESVAPLAVHYDVLVRPHPNFMEFGEMLQRFGLRTTAKPTAALVPLSDLFIAFASATIRWAIACGIPTVNYDVFHYGYRDFSTAAGVVMVADGAEFRQLVQALSPASPRLATLAASAKRDSAHWSLMDGESLLRIEHQIHEARRMQRSDGRI